MLRQMTEEDQIRAVHHKYEIPEDTVKTLLKEGIRYLDIDKAALIACLSGKSIQEILARRKEQPWGKILKNLGLTGETYEEKYNAHRARRLHRFYGVEEKERKKLWKKATRTTGSAWPTSWKRKRENPWKKSWR